MRFKAIMLKLSLCDYSDAYILEQQQSMEHGQMQQREMQMQDISKKNSKIVHDLLPALPKQILC